MPVLARWLRQLTGAGAVATRAAGAVAVDRGDDPIAVVVHATLSESVVSESA